MKRVKIALVAVLVTGVVVSVSGGVAYAGSISMLSFAQEKSQWCWVATTQNIVRYTLGSSPDQCTLTKIGRVKTTCDNEPAGLAEIERTYRNRGILKSTATSRVLTLAEVKAEIDAKRPFQVRYKNATPKGTPETGHYVTVYGYAWNSKDLVDIIYWHDPGGAVKVNSTYGYLKSNSKWTWTHSMYKIGAK